ncbi:hypothetical protein F7725_007845 [Dissostichus mawsoni]|uniref:Uncharacterized protein n=1 Tax=Dissostichus mawsoni TaxID=36200 RepID=A0A7J5Y5J0_DISMA|nr:hypothetical protein F7725_007845 [Dissostichus mawsoni]
MTDTAAFVASASTCWSCLTQISCSKGPLASFHSLNFSERILMRGALRHLGVLLFLNLPLWEPGSNQDCRCLASEEVELCDVMVLTGEESEPVASLGTAEE